MNTDEKNPGYLVETKTGKKGRTYHREGLVMKKPLFTLKMKTVL